MPLGWSALSSAGVLLICLFTVGTLIWLAEHRTNPDNFPCHSLRGAGNGMWFALVTLTSVGYSDWAPVAPAPLPKLALMDRAQLSCLLKV
ncbi:potassium channel family protein [Synechococcus sp. RedBA-s]|uniref:potassium channel family protein n=1 Tax=Synechococcus sp. RedBA-s TaxID=2823741 RepID=UPI0020CCDEC8|nr:potassium channel family protein [Synechococcus sp. RedBA-s]MCP9800084.1 two pore domain potassium channel family protein [Synechococcus sp. RedBA-s]